VGGTWRLSLLKPAEINSRTERRKKKKKKHAFKTIFINKKTLIKEEKWELGASRDAVFLAEGLAVNAKKNE